MDEALISNFDKEDIEKNIITIFKSNGLSFGGNYMNLEKNKFTLINFVKNDSYIYKKMKITIGNYNVELDVSKEKK